MSIFEISAELFDESDSTSDSTFESASSLSSLESNSDLTDSDSSISSIETPMARRTRRMGNLLAQSSESSSSENQNSSISETDSSDDSFHSGMASNSQIVMSESDVANNSGSSSQSSDTEPYDVDEEMSRINTGPVIEINDTQMPNNEQDDDDVILIPPNIETIDLCTQAVVIPERLRNEVIDITDSPGTENSHAGPIRRRRSRTNAQPVYVADHPAQPTPQPPTTSTPNARQRLNMDDSMNDSQPRIALTCPICLDTVVNRTPVSTLCGHIFCQPCIVQALGNAKKCPMCKKALNGRKPYFNIFLPC